VGWFGVHVVLGWDSRVGLVFLEKDWPNRCSKFLCLTEFEWVLEFEFLSWFQWLKVDLGFESFIYFYFFWEVESFIKLIEDQTNYRILSHFIIFRKLFECWFWEILTFCENGFNCRLKGFIDAFKMILLREKGLSIIGWVLWSMGKYIWVFVIGY
jgi:hypothetical protein